MRNSSSSSSVPGASGGNASSRRRNASRAEPADTANAACREFGRRQCEIERIFIEEIPVIGSQFVLHLIEKAGRTDEMKGGGSVEAQPQQAIETREMMHVGVRNERMRDAQELACGQRRHVAEVEQQGAAAETEIDEQRRIRKRIVDEPRLHEPSHFLPLLARSARTCRRRSAA